MRVSLRTFELPIPTADKQRLCAHYTTEAIGVAALAAPCAACPSHHTVHPATLGIHPLQQGRQGPCPCPCPLPLRLPPHVAPGLAPAPAHDDWRPLGLDRDWRGTARLAQHSQAFADPAPADLAAADLVVQHLQVHHHHHHHQQQQQGAAAVAVAVAGAAAGSVTHHQDPPCPRWCHCPE